MFHLNGGNDLATVLFSAMCIGLLVKQLLSFAKLLIKFGLFYKSIIIFVFFCYPLNITIFLGSFSVSSNYFMCLSEKGVNCNAKRLCAALRYES